MSLQKAKRGQQLKNMLTGNPGEAQEASKTDGRSPYLLWLIWVVWLPLSIPSVVLFFQSHPPLPRLIATLAGVALFFIIYLWAALRRAHQLAASSSLPARTQLSTWVTIGALTMLSVTILVLGGKAWEGGFFYVSGYVGGSFTMRRGAPVALAMTLIVVTAGWLTGLAWIDLLQIVVFIPAIVIITRVVMWSITTSWALHAARKEIARLAVMTERLRIARDLHDLLGHNLSLIALKSELARRLVTIAPERAIVEIGDVEHVARTMLQEVREAVGNYRQPTLSSELQGAREILSAAGIACLTEGDESATSGLATPVEAALAWAVREGVTNVIRHSRARECVIRVTRQRQTAGVEIIDDGAGNGAGDGAGNDRGNGLRGLAERVDALGGQFEAGPRSGGGFRLAVSVPLVQRAGTPADLSTVTAHSAQPALLGSPEQSVGGEEGSIPQ